MDGSVFEECTNLMSVTLSKSFPTIYFHTFYNCKNLTSLVIPESVTQINICAFEGCSGLESVYVPASLTTIEGEAFQGCNNLRKVYYAAEEPVALSSVYEGGVSSLFENETYENATRYVPERAVEKCKAVEPWCNFKTIEAHDFTGIEEVVADFDASLPYEIFTLGGMSAGSDIDGLAPGLYIVRQGGTVRKISVN